VARLSDFALAHHGIYRAFRRLTGSARVNREFVERYVCPSDGDAVLDLGCGPGDVFELMPQVRYVGIDLSENYVAAARRRFGGRARFLCGDLNSVEMERLGNFDRVIAMGVMHHLSDDEVVAMLHRIREFLKPDGRFISYDPGFTERQHPFARWLHKHDRGRFVRFDRQYEQLISKVFSSYRRHIRTDMCTVPATVIIFECSQT
jgi:cyclopropane fatty-acyl-phospholipid synthase-like methyltransferase